VKGSQRLVGLKSQTLADETMKSMMQWARSFPAGLGTKGARAADHRSHRLSECRLPSDLRLEFRKASLGSVLTYLRESAGLIIHVNSNVKMDPTLDLWRDQPVSTADALALLKQVLIEKGCTLIPKGPLFNIIRSQDVKKNSIPLPEL
jgi:hypothetical protein